MAQDYLQYGAEQSHGGAEEDPYDDAAEEEDEDDAVAADGVEGVERVVGQQVADEAAGVERRDGEEIEEEQGQVHLDGEQAKQCKRLWSRGAADEELALQGAVDGFASSGYSDDEDHEHQEGGEGEQQVGGGAGEGDVAVVAGDSFEVARGDGNGLAPAHDDAAVAEPSEAEERSEDHQGRVEKGAHGIDVVCRIEADAALEASGLIAKPRGHPGMRALVYGEREEQDDKFEERDDQVDT